MGYNSEAVEYYGYIPDGGEWVLADADGNVLDSVDGAEVAEVSNYQTFTASKPGTYYVKFLIDETLYSSVDDNSIKITNADLSSTPMLRVNVTETGKDHTCSAGPEHTYSFLPYLTQVASSTVFQYAATPPASATAKCSSIAQYAASC